MQYLCISVCFLDALYHGKADREGEWPPSPLRLFQALLAGSQTGYRKTEWSDVKVAAFRWLERRKPPLIIAPRVKAALSYTFFVPNNDGDKEQIRQDRLTSKIALPHRMLDGQAVHYLWQVQDIEGEDAMVHCRLLAHEARHLLALGWGIDMVAGHGRLLSEAEADALVGERWQSYDVEGTFGSALRVPIANTLDNLIEVYQAKLNRLAHRVYSQPPTLSAFKTVCYLKETELPRRPWAIFALAGATDDASLPALRQEDTVQVAGMVRHVAYEQAKRDSGVDFPGGIDFYVAGHRSDTHQSLQRFAYLPLPSIGHPKSDGMIRRVLIAGAYDSDGSQVRWAERRLREAELVGERTGEIVAVLTTPANNDSVPSRYTGLSESWATVTPITLPGFDEGNYKKAMGLMAKAITHAGISLDAVADVTLRKAPFWPGSQHPAHYFRPKHMQQHAAWHAHIRFREPVYGPLTIGSGRFCGLGLFAAMRS